MSSHDDREEALFEKSLRLPPEEREAFVRWECGSDEELAECVLALLRSHDSAGEFLERCPEKHSARVASQLEKVAPADEQPGDQIGRYRLREKIGEGAWGSVWIAQQTEDIDRQVAIKILKVGMDTKDFLARFEAERQMLAMMDHPSIAHVIDARATERGRPYLVMELVKGIQILEFSDKNRLGIRERVRLFVKVCRAIHHAHRKGVVHRDLKPSNILVSSQYDEALPKVIDFGVAKSNQFNLTDKTVYTGMHAFMGTPVYSSPEQLDFAGQEVDARSDIYSLGALLYELLSGAAPFDGVAGDKNALAEFVRRVREEEPLRPSQRFSRLPEQERNQIASCRRLIPSKLENLLNGDLDWIVIKCLEKNPARRYQTAKELADDLRSFLDHQAVSATAPSPIYRLRRFISRNRPAYALWVEMSAVVAACLAVAFYYVIKRPSYVEQTPLEISEESSIQFTDKSIAIIPLRNLSPDPVEAYFADAIHEEIVSNVMKISDLRVIPITSLRQYRHTQKTVGQIGDELDVRYVIEGSAIREGDRAGITLNLIDARTEAPIWSETYRYTDKDLFALRSEVAKDVASQLQASVLPEELEVVEAFPTNSREAYDLYLRSRQHYGSEAEIPFLKKAVAIDPDFYEAWTGLAWRGLFLFSEGGARTNDAELRVLAENAIQQMERLRPGERLNLGVRAAYERHINHDLEATLQYRLQAVKRGGKNRDVAWTYLEMGKLEPARLGMEETLPNPPELPTLYLRLYTAYLCLGMSEEARSLLENWVEKADEENLERILDPTRSYRRMKRVLAQHRYLEEGDFVAHRRATRELLTFSEDSWGDLWSFLVSRDYSSALSIVERIRNSSTSPKNSLRITGAGVELLFRGQLAMSLDIEPLCLLEALIHFEEGEREQWLERTAEAKGHWESVIAAHDKIDPNHLAFLAICHALEGNRSQMEATIPKVRELTKSINWQFRAQAKCEVKLAIAYLVLGDEEKALDLLEYADDLHSPMFINRELELWFFFDRLKGNPRYETLVEKDKGARSVSGYSNTQQEDLAIPDSKSIAILPFENLSGREEDVLYSKGLHRTLLTRISQLKDVRSVSPTSVKTFSGTNKRLTEIARELKVAHLLTGDVQVLGEQIRVNVQLIEATADHPLWGKTYTRDLTAEDFFSIESDIAESVAETLRAVLTPQERDQLVKFPTRDTEALERFIEGTSVLESGIQTRRQESIDSLKKAIDLDPGFVLAYINLSRAYLSEAAVSIRDRDWWERAFSDAEAAAMMALQLDNNSAEAHTLLCQIQIDRANRWEFEGDLDLAKRSIERALELNPNYAEAYLQRGELLLKELDRGADRGATAERLTLSWFRKAIELDPQNHLYRDRLGFLLNDLGEFDESRKHLEEAVRINPEFAVGLRRLAIQLFSVFGEYDNAIALFRRAVAIDPTRFEPHELQYHCYWTLGDELEAFRWHKAGMGSGIGWNAGGDADKAKYRVAHYQIRNDHERYLEQLRIAVEKSSNWSNYRRFLLNEDMREGRARMALKRYNDLFPYLFEAEVNFDQQRLAANGAGTMEPRNQACAAMELAEILIRLGEKERAYYLLDVAGEFFEHHSERTNWHWFYHYGYGIRDAAGFALRGETEEALAAIREAVDGVFRDRLELESSVFDALREEPEFQAAMEIVEADWARQLANVRRMEANGELAPIPDEPRYDFETPASILAINEQSRL